MSSIFEDMKKIAEQRREHTWFREVHSSLRRQAKKKGLKKFRILSIYDKETPREQGNPVLETEIEDYDELRWFGYRDFMGVHVAGDVMEVILHTSNYGTMLMETGRETEYYEWINAINNYYGDNVM